MKGKIKYSLEMARKRVGKKTNAQIEEEEKKRRKSRLYEIYTNKRIKVEMEIRHIWNTHIYNGKSVQIIKRTKLQTK